MSRSGLVAALLGFALIVLVVMAGSARASLLTPGAVFTESNTAPTNVVHAFNRNAHGALTAAGDFATGGSGQTANPPSGFPVLDSSGPVELSGDGDNRSCLFAVNAGSDTVSSFRVRPDGLELADQEASNGRRPVSVTSTTRGPGKQLLYVLNSDASSASIQGYYVSASCGLTPIPGSNRPTSTPDSVPAAIRFDQHGRMLAVSERFASAGDGDIDIFPVDKDGVAGAPVVNPSVGRTPYGLDFNNQNVLSVSNENVPAFPGSTVTTYSLTRDGHLVPLSTAPSPGAACWNVFTNNGKFVYVTNPVGKLVGASDVNAFRVDRNGALALIDTESAHYNPIDDGLSHDSRYLYVLSIQLAPVPGPNSAINEYAIDPGTGALTPIGEVDIPENNTSGLAAW